MQFFEQALVDPFDCSQPIISQKSQNREVKAGFPTEKSSMMDFVFFLRR
jgi:hypothetical protein